MQFWQQGHGLDQEIETDHIINQVRQGTCRDLSTAQVVGLSIQPYHSHPREMWETEEI